MERLTIRGNTAAKNAWMACLGTCANVDVPCGCCPELDKVVNRLAAYEDTRLTPEDIQEAVDLFRQTLSAEKADVPKEIKSWVDRCTWHVRKCTDLTAKLLKYKDAEEQGLLVRLPCKVGDTVYQIDAERVYESTVRYLVFETENIAFDERAIAKSIFLTREEAEAALAKEG